MSRKRDYNYFDTFVQLVDYSCAAADLLRRTLETFDVNELPEKMVTMHAIEHAADLAKHELMHELAHAFITPLEREDIVQLTHEIDEVTDSIEDILIRLYMFNITTLRAEAFEFTGIILQCCTALKETMQEFSNFKKPDKLYKSIIAINRLEEEGDKLYTEAMHTLYVTCKNPIEVMSWTETFHRLEKCCDTCEHAANVVEGVIMKNT